MTRRLRDVIMALPTDLHPAHGERLQRHRQRDAMAADDDTAALGEGRTSHAESDVSRAAQINTLYLETKAHMVSHKL